MRQQYRQAVLVFDARIYAPDGQAFSLEEYRLLHQQWTDESHRLGDSSLTTLCQDRYRESPASGSGVIKAVVGEDWVIERRADGTLCFVLYWYEIFSSIARLGVHPPRSVILRSSIPHSRTLAGPVHTHVRLMPFAERKGAS